MIPTGRRTQACLFFLSSLCSFDYSAFLFKCRESRRSPTYEAYPRSRRSLSRSRSHSPSYSRRYSRGGHSDDVHRSKPRTPKIEYITEFGSSGDRDQPKLGGFSPPSSPPSQADMLNRSAHSTFNSCKDRFDSLYSAAAAAYSSFCYVRQNFLV